MIREAKRKVPVRLCKNGALLPLWPVPYFWHVRMRFSLILCIDIYLYSRKRKQRENGLCAGKHQYTHEAYFNKYYIVSVRHFVYIFFLMHSFVKYGNSGPDVARVPRLDSSEENLSAVLDFGTGWVLYNTWRGYRTLKNKKKCGKK